MEYIDSVLYETNEIPFNKTFCTVIVFVVFDCSIGYDVVLFFGCNYLMMTFVVLHLSYGWGSLNGIISVLKYGK